MNANGMSSATSANTVEAVIDRVSTAELRGRYRLGSRTGLSNRMEALGIEAYKEGKQYYVPVDAVEQLDALNECLKRSGATLAECARSIQQMQNSSQEDSCAIAESGASLADAKIMSDPNNNSNNRVDKTTDERGSAINSWQYSKSMPTLPYPWVNWMQQAIDPLANYRLLDEVAQKGWALPTSQLLPMLGLKSVPRLTWDEGGAFFRRRGFKFERQPKEGLESEWRAIKNIG